MTNALRVLMVEDTETDAKLVARELRRGGRLVEFERVETAEAMRAALKRGSWDVVTSDWSNGSRYEGRGNGNLIFDGENLEVDPPRRLVQNFRALWGEDVKGEGTSRVTWEIEPVGDSCRLTVTHDHLREGANNQLYGGWPMVLSGIKTLLESGEMLTTPGSLRWLQGNKEQLPEVPRQPPRTLPSWRRWLIGSRARAPAPAFQAFAPGPTP